MNFSHLDVQAVLVTMYECITADLVLCPAISCKDAVSVVILFYQMTLFLFYLLNTDQQLFRQCMIFPTAAIVLLCYYKCLKCKDH